MLFYNHYKSLWYETTSKWRLVARPILRSCNQSSLTIIDHYYQSWNYSTNGTTNGIVNHSVARPIALVVSPRSCALDGTTLHNWSHYYVPPVCDCLRFVSAGPEFRTLQYNLLWLSMLVRSPTTSKINRTIGQRFICDLSYFVVRL